MNDQTEANINEAINWLQATGGSIQDFATEQAPLYCREVVQLHLWQGTFGVAIALILLLWGIFSLTKAGKVEDPYASSAQEGWGISAMLSLIAVVAIGTPCGFMVIKANVAPRVVIVEHLQDLRK